jgi:hypothetical protein
VNVFQIQSNIRLKALCGFPPSPVNELIAQGKALSGFWGHAYINEMQVSSSKIPSKKFRQAALRGGFNPGVKGLIRARKLTNNKYWNKYL